MSFKNILVALAPGGKADRGTDFAISMAMKLQAHIRGQIYAIEPDVGFSGLSGVPADILQANRAALAKEAEQAVKAFADAAKRAKVQVTIDSVRTTLNRATDTFAQQARVHDVTVVTQSAKGLEHVGDVFAEAALVSSGRPLIVVPKSGSQEFSVSRVMVAWDGSLYAARAVALAMPLLAQARKVEVVVVGDKARVQASRARELVSNLERYGVDVELTTRNDADHAETIAREAKSASASLLIMGGYGHSKLRQFVFGGVTRHMLRDAKLPVLMAH